MIEQRQAEFLRRTLLGDKINAEKPKVCVHDRGILDRGSDLPGAAAARRAGIACVGARSVPGGDDGRWYPGRLHGHRLAEDRDGHRADTGGHDRAGFDRDRGAIPAGADRRARVPTSEPRRVPLATCGRGRRTASRSASTRRRRPPTDSSCSRAHYERLPSRRAPRPISDRHHAWCKRPGPGRRARRAGDQQRQPPPLPPAVGSGRPRADTAPSACCVPPPRHREDLARLARRRLRRPGELTAEVTQLASRLLAARRPVTAGVRP